MRFALIFRIATPSLYNGLPVSTGNRCGPSAGYCAEGYCSSGGYCASGSIFRFFFFKATGVPVNGDARNSMDAVNIQHQFLLVTIPVRFLLNHYNGFKILSTTMSMITLNA